MRVASQSLSSRKKREAGSYWCYIRQVALHISNIRLIKLGNHDRN
jgi:hypothetical protein